MMHRKYDSLISINQISPCFPKPENNDYDPSLSKKGHNDFDHLSSFLHPNCLTLVFWCQFILGLFVCLQIHWSQIISAFFPLPTCPRLGPIVQLEFCGNNCMTLNCHKLISKTPFCQLAE